MKLPKSNDIWRLVNLARRLDPGRYNIQKRVMTLFFNKKNNLKLKCGPPSLIDVDDVSEWCNLYLESWYFIYNDQIGFRIDSDQTLFVLKWGHLVL